MKSKLSKQAAAWKARNKRNMDAASKEAWRRLRHGIKHDKNPHGH